MDRPEMIEVDERSRQIGHVMLIVILSSEQVTVLLFCSGKDGRRSIWVISWFVLMVALDEMEKIPSKRVVTETHFKCLN